VFSGSAETFKESFNSLGFALLLGLIVAYMVLGAQFNSFVHPFTVLLALPFSLTGALLALKLTGITLNLYSVIGVLLLMGIVKKNSILLVDFTNERRKRGEGVGEALLSACPLRLRPILMTSASTIAGALPAAFAIGAGAETVRPMAVVVIGGIIASTLLTLFVVPPAYSLLSRLQSHRHDADLREALRELGELKG
jgi:HAE1 family hydrophobic/amphiphilic exporter-1